MTRREWSRRLLSAVFPDRCPYCGEVIHHTDRLCENCAGNLVVIEGDTCEFCGLPAKECRCGKRPHPYDRCLAPLYYEKMVRRGVLRMKEQERPYVVEELGLRMIRRFIQSGEARPDGVTFVPMTHREERARGFNQSRLLAMQVAEGLDVPLLSVLQKVQETRPQKTLSALERTGNVLGAFDLTPTADVTGKNLLLIDDLVTTGSTAGECAKVLKLYGAERVVLLTAAINSIREPNLQA